MNLQAMMDHISAERKSWAADLAGVWPPKRVTKRLKTVAEALCRAECVPGLWSRDETEKRVRRDWRRYLWPAAVALHAAAEQETMQ